MLHFFEYLLQLYCNKTLLSVYSMIRFTHNVRILVVPVSLLGGENLEISKFKPLSH